MLNKRRLTVFTLIFISLSFAACKSHSKFNQDDWNDGDGLTFSYRERMVDDLLENYKLKGLKYQQVIHLLHRPQQSNTSEMVYDIKESLIPGKSRYIKQLVLSMKDSVVTGAKIQEHTFKQTP